MFKEGQMLRHKNTGKVYLLVKDKNNQPEIGNFKNICIKGNTKSFGEKEAEFYGGFFPYNAYEVVRLSDNSSFEVVEEEEKFYKIGDKFKSTWSGSEYLLCSVDEDNSVNIVNINEGTRLLTNPIKVENFYRITEEELKEFLVCYEKI